MKVDVKLISDIVDIIVAVYSALPEDNKPNQEFNRIDIFHDIINKTPLEGLSLTEIRNIILDNPGAFAAFGITLKPATFSLGLHKIYYLGEFLF